MVHKVEGERAPGKRPAPAPESASPEGGNGSGIDIANIFQEEEEVDEAYQELVNSVGEIGALDLASQLQELMTSLSNRG